ncbi:hypothetical protein GCM10009551_061290 [Nocardiopsis tropica]
MLSATKTAVTARIAGESDPFEAREKPNFWSSWAVEMNSWGQADQDVLDHSALPRDGVEPGDLGE